MGLLLCFAAACQQNGKQGKEAFINELKALEKQVVKTGDASKEPAASKALVEKTLQFAKAYPKDEATPKRLFFAADVARGAGEYAKAVQLWGLVWRNYPEHPKAPMALFLQGFTFDSNLQNTQMAGKYYKDFLKKYPNDSLATQVKQLLRVVEIPPDDLVKKFQNGERQN